MLGISLIGFAQTYDWAIGFYTIGMQSTQSQQSVTVDANGNSYTTGYFSGTLDFDPSPDTASFTTPFGTNGYISQAFIAKYDADGNYLWATPIADSITSESIAVDDNGNIYITGEFRGTADFDPGPDIVTLTATPTVYVRNAFIAKYDANGNYLWAIGFHGIVYSPSIGSSHGKIIDVDDSDNVYVTGTFSGAVDFDPGPDTVYLYTTTNNTVFITKYDTDGNYLWATKDIPISLSSSTKRSICFADNGSFYTTGESSSIYPDFDPGPDTVNIDCNLSHCRYVAKYDTDGNYLWAIGIDGVSYYGEDVAVDELGNVYIVGASFNGTVDFDPGPDIANVSALNGRTFIAKYDANGNYLWAIEHGNHTQGYRITVNGNNVYVVATMTAKSDKEGGCLNSISKYSSFGSLIWSYYYQSGSVCASIITSDTHDNFYALGWFSGTVDFDPGPGTSQLSGPGIFLLKLSGSTTDIEHIHSTQDKSFVIYPNPTKQQSVTIETSDIIINVQCYDLMGQLLFETQNKVLNVNDLSQGTYLIKVRTDNGCFTKKLIVQ